MAVNVGAFNLANAIGSALGGLGAAWGLLRLNGFAGAAFAILGLALAALSLRATQTPDTTDNDSPTKETIS
jgi:DHA1 family inner membrane transport protein